MAESDSSEVIVAFDIRVTRVDAVKKAAYRFGNRCSANIRLVSEYVAEVKLTSTASNVDLEMLASDFQTEVLDQELREVVADETANIRNLLLAQAFSETALIDQIGEEAPFDQDPLGIRHPDST